MERHRPTSLGDYAIAALRQDLIEGRLRPGQRLAAEEIARQLGISHIPVREALRFLEAQGHLERDPRSHVQVASVTVEEAEEIYRLRALLEEEAYRDGVPQLTEEDLTALGNEYSAMSVAVEHGDVAAFASANRRFHFIPFRRSSKKWQSRFLDNLWDAAARCQSSLFLEEGWEQRLQDHHALLLRAAQRRDPDEVNRLMVEHRLVTIDAARAWVRRSSQSSPPVVNRAVEPS